ncbi:MAG: helix-turn-helix domain-containing protein [Rhodococcus sp. (in: high G+C Gram-positive bacteria)]
MKRQSSDFVHADGRIVIVPVRAAQWIDKALRSKGVNRSGDPEVDAVLIALRLAALQCSSTANGPNTVAQQSDSTDLSQWLSSSEAAVEAGVGERSIRKAIATGRLDAHDINGRWLINRDDAKNYRSRNRTA